MSSISDLARKWREAQEEAQTTGTRSAVRREQELRQQLHNHPATDRARHQVNGQAAPRSGSRGWWS